MMPYVKDSMSCEKVPFAVCIDKFSLRVCRGYYETLVGEQGGKWSLILNMSDGHGYEDFIEIRLRRNEYNGRDQFVELKLSIVNCFGFSGLFESLTWPFGPAKLNQFCFTGSSETHKVLSVNSNSRLCKLYYLPNDTLTLRGEMIISEEEERRFETEDGFKDSLKNSSSDRAAAVRWFLFICSMIHLSVVGSGYAAISAITYLHKYVIVPLVDILLLFPAVLSFSFWFFGRVKKEVKKILRDNSRKRRNTPKPNRYSRGDQQLVPYGGHGGNVGNAWYGVYRLRKPEKYGNRKQGRKYLMDADYSCKRRDRFYCE